MSAHMYVHARVCLCARVHIPRGVIAALSVCMCLCLCICVLYMSLFVLAHTCRPTVYLLADVFCSCFFVINSICVYLTPHMSFG